MGARNFVSGQRSAWRSRTIKLVAPRPVGRPSRSCSPKRISPVGAGFWLHHASLDGTGQCIVRRLETGFSDINNRDSYSGHAGHVRLVGPPVVPGVCSLTTIRGVTTLAATGFPEYIIAFYGGWAPNSKSMKQYIQPTDDIIRIVSGHMSLSRNSEPVQAVVNQLLAHRVPQSLCSGVPGAGRQGGGPRGRRRR